MNETVKQSAAQRLLHVVTSKTQLPDDIDDVLDLANAGDTQWHSLSGGERALLEIALSLEYGRSVNLRFAFAVMDHEHIELCLDAMHETAGVDG